MRNNIFLDSVFGTGFIFFLIGVVFKFSAFGIFNVFDPIGDAVGDMDLTDIVFSRMRDVPPADTNIVIVNIGSLPRAGIAEEINIIKKYEPAVMGLDCFFESIMDPIGDSILKATLEACPNLVLASRLERCSEAMGGCDSVGGSLPFFVENLNVGYANLISDAAHQEKFKTNRTFAPTVNSQGQPLDAFSVKILRSYNPESVRKLLERNKKYEVINFRGYAGIGGRFFSLDIMDVFTENFDPNLIKGKIVLFGYLGNDFSDKSWEDKYYTPLNEDYAGRTNPDMYGVSIHANIIAMIINEDYIGLMSENASIFLGILLCYLNVVLFTLIYRKIPLWYDGLTKLIQVLEVILLFFIIVLIFHYFQFKVNLTLGFVAVLLAGDALEVYQGVGKNGYHWVVQKLGISKRKPS